MAGVGVGCLAYKIASNLSLISFSDFITPEALKRFAHPAKKLSAVGSAYDILEDSDSEEPVDEDKGEYNYSEPQP